MRSLRLGLIAAAALLVAACATPAPQKTQIITCDTFTAALLVVNQFDDAGKLTDPMKVSIRQAVSLADPFCGTGATQVSTTSGAISDITKALAALNSVIAQVKGGA